MPRLNGKVAIVTGAARGLGAAYARAFVREGASVVLTDVLDGTAIADELGPAARFVSHDVSDEAGWAEVVSATTETYGSPTVLVNNAGILRVGTMADMSLADFDAVLRVNVAGTWLGMRTVAPIMAEHGGGSIINASSAAGMAGYPTLSAYVASKFAVRGLTKVAALEFGHAHVRVNSIHPGAIRTPMLGDPEQVDVNGPNEFSDQAIPRYGEPEEVAALVVFLASDEASYCTGAEYIVDGGILQGRALASFGADRLADLRS